tara:strand:- start:3490 stop:3666 length:177 start_codon:yes stop_codon:yes gene_type:complete
VAVLALETSAAALVVLVVAATVLLVVQAPEALAQPIQAVAVEPEELLVLTAVLAAAES